MNKKINLIFLCLILLNTGKAQTVSVKYPDSIFDFYEILTAKDINRMMEKYQSNLELFTES